MEVFVELLARFALAIECFGFQYLSRTPVTPEAPEHGNGDQGYQPDEEERQAYALKQTCKSQVVMAGASRFWLGLRGFCFSTPISHRRLHGELFFLVWPVGFGVYCEVSLCLSWKFFRPLAAGDTDIRRGLAYFPPPIIKIHSWGRGSTESAPLNKESASVRFECIRSI